MRKVEDGVKVGAGVEIGDHAVRGGYRQIEQAIFPRDTPHGQQPSNDDAAIEEITMMMAVGGGRWVLKRKGAQLCIPGVIAKKPGSQSRAIQIPFVLRPLEQKDQGTRRIPGYLGRNRLVFLSVRAVETGHATEGRLNARMEKPVSGPRERKCSRQTVS